MLGWSVLTLVSFVSLSSALTLPDMVKLNHREPQSALTTQTVSTTSCDIFCVLFGSTTISSSSTISTTVTSTSNNSRTSTSSPPDPTSSPPTTIVGPSSVSQSMSTATTTKSSQTSTSSSPNPTSSPPTSIVGPSSVSQSTSTFTESQAPASTTTQALPSSRKPKTTVIVGSVCGAIAVVSALSLSLFILQYRRRRFSGRLDAPRPSTVAVDNMPFENLSAETLLDPTAQSQTIEKNSASTLDPGVFRSPSMQQTSCPASSAVTERQLQIQVQEEELTVQIAASTQTVLQIVHSSSSDQGVALNTVLNNAMNKISQLQAEVDWLREQCDSDWGLGLTDVPPAYGLDDCVSLTT